MGANAEFAIEIAASMGDGETTIAELDALASHFTGAGKNATAFQEAIAKLSGDLDVASQAQAAANAALAEGQAKYALLETAALQASKAAEKLAKGGMTREYLEVAQKAALAESAVSEYAGTLRVLEANAQGAAREEDRLAQTLGNVKKLGAHANTVIARHAEALSKVGGALGAVGGPLGSLGRKVTAPIKGFTELSGVMGSTNAAALLATVGVVGLAAAIVAVAGAAVFGIGKLTFWAVKLADKEGRLATQTDRLSSNFDGLFSGLNIDPVIDGMTILADLFDRNTAAGEAISSAFEGIFQPIVDNATAAAQAVEAFVLGFLIGATKLYIALKPTIKGIAEFFGFDDPALSLSFETITDVGKALAPVILGVVAAFAGAVAIVGVFVGTIASLIAVAAALPAMLIHVGVSIVSGIVDAFTKAVEFVRGLDFVQMGIQMMQGLASGIMNGAGAVVNAITNAAKGAINAAKAALGIASPSKVFADIGGFTGEGFTSGVEAENDNAQAALTGLVSPDAAIQEASSTTIPATIQEASSASIPSVVDDRAVAAPAANAASGGERKYTFNFYGVENAEQAEQRFQEMLTANEEALALALGADEEAAA
jgi:hypothetical protein